MKPPLIILTGPTAVGKTDLSLQLAKAVGGEIISADSMQVYRHMNIGTAKLKKENMCGVPHYLINVLEPGEDFNVAIFQSMAKQSIAEIYKNKHIPILTGGTGFYIQAVLYDIDFEEHGEDHAVRRDLEILAKKKGPEYLYEMLQKIDPEAACQIHKNNVKRVIRALEYFQQTNKRISQHNEEQRSRESAYNAAYFVLSMDRARLYERINLRVDQMMEQGLLNEVRSLIDRGIPENSTAMQGLGYKEFLPYIHGEQTLEEAVSILKRNTRHFAKRQLTWFRRERDVIWLNGEQEKDKLLASITEILQKRYIIL